MDLGGADFKAISDADFKREKTNKGPNSAEMLDFASMSSMFHAFSWFSGFLKGCSECLRDLFHFRAAR